MQVQAPKGQYRVIGLDHIDTLDSPSGPSVRTSKLRCCQRLADRMIGGIPVTYVYDDAGELLRASSYRWKQVNQLKC